MFSPTLQETLAIAEEKKYDVLPISCEILSDSFTPIGVLQILKNVSTHCYLLESVSDSAAWGRYTFLGFAPKLGLTCDGDSISINGVTIPTTNPSDYIRQILQEGDAEVPWTSGLPWL